MFMRKTSQTVSDHVNMVYQMGRTIGNENFLVEHKIWDQARNVRARARSSSFNGMKFHARHVLARVRE